MRANTPQFAKISSENDEEAYARYIPFFTTRNTVPSGVGKSKSEERWPFPTLPVCCRLVYKPFPFIITNLRDPIFSIHWSAKNTRKRDSLDGISCGLPDFVKEIMFSFGSTNIPLRKRPGSDALPSFMEITIDAHLSNSAFPKVRVLRKKDDIDRQKNLNTMLALLAICDAYASKAWLYG